MVHCTPEACEKVAPGRRRRPGVDEAIMSRTPAGVPDERRRGARTCRIAMTMSHPVALRTLPVHAALSRERLAAMIGRPGSALLEGWCDEGDPWQIVLPWPDEIREVREGGPVRWRDLLIWMRRHCCRPVAPGGNPARTRRRRWSCSMATRRTGWPRRLGGGCWKRLGNGGMIAPAGDSRV